MNLELLALALEAALYPTLLAAVVILMSQPQRVKLLAAYLAGGLTMSVGIGLIIVLGLHGAGGDKGSSSGLSWQVDLAVGGLALLAAVALSTRADERLRERRKSKHPPKATSDERDPWSQRILARGSAPIVFVAALAINVPGAAYLVGLKDIANGGHSTGTEILLIVAFNAIMFLLAEIPLLGLLLAPERTESLVVRTDAALSRNGRRIAIGGCLLFSAFLIVRGLLNS